MHAAGPIHFPCLPAISTPLDACRIPTTKQLPWWVHLPLQPAQNNCPHNRRIQCQYPTSGPHGRWPSKTGSIPTEDAVLHASNPHAAKKCLPPHGNNFVGTPPDKPRLLNFIDGTVPTGALPNGFNKAQTFIIAPAEASPTGCVLPCKRASRACRPALHLEAQSEPNL